MAASRLLPYTIDENIGAAQLHLKTGDLAQAWSAVERAWALVPRVERTQEFRSSVHRAAAVRAQIQLMVGELAGSRETVRLGRSVAGDHPGLDFLEASAWEALARKESDPVARDRLIDAALGGYRAALASDSDPNASASCPLEGATSWAAWTRVGMIHLLRKEPELAGSAFDRALQTRPGHLEALLGKVECDLQRGDPSAVLSAVEAHLDERPDGWILAAAAAEEAGALEPMATFVVRANEMLRRGYVSVQRSERHAELVCALAAYRGAPTGGPGQVGAMGALLARAPIPRGFAAPRPSDVRIVRRMTRNLVACRRTSDVTAWLETRAESTLPGIGAHVRATLSELGIEVGDDGESEPIFLVGDDRSAVDFVACLLSAHPRLTCCDAEEALVEWARAPSPTLEALIALLPRCDGDKRIVYVAASLGGSSDSVVTLLPNARWLRVVAHRASAGTALPLMGRCLDIQVDALLDAPVERIEHLLAFLGEPMVEDLIRHVIDHYPRRSRRRPSESAALQGAHA